MSVTNAFSVDLEDWFHGLTSTNVRPQEWDRHEERVEANTRRLLRLLNEYDVTATFFVLGYVANRYPGLIVEIEAAGHEIGVHGYWHRKVDQLAPDQFAVELDQALEAIAPLVNQPILGHRAPYFSINRHSLWALEVLQEKGFCYDSSFFPTRNMLYGYPEAPRFPHSPKGSKLVEFPISTAQWGNRNWPIGGGFYVRFLPYKIVQAGIRQLNRQGVPAIMYIHPWELDTAQEYGKVTPRERITHYHGRAGLEEKLRRLFTEFQFAPLRACLDSQHASLVSQ